MQQLILACGSNPLAPIMLLVGGAILLSIIFSIKYFFLTKTHRSVRRSLFLDSFSLMCIDGLFIVLIIFCTYFLPVFLFFIEIGNFYSFQIIMWGIICIVDTFFIKRWSLKPGIQAISLTKQQELKVEPVNRNYLPAWAAALLSNTIIGILIVLLL